MAEFVTTLRLAGYAIGALGGVLLFAEFFQQPSYVEYETEFDSYSLDISPTELRQYTWLGRVGALLVSLAFAVEFAATLLG
jgi:hypothetical protein